MSTPNGIKIIAKNRRASFDYELLDRFEAGLVLQGTEIKSIRNNRVNLKGSFVQNIDGELWLIDAHISPYEHAGRDNHDPMRKRKLLLHRREINKITGRLAERGLTLIPTMIYLKNGRAKLEIALGRGKKSHDKRSSLAKKDADRQIARALRDRNRY